MTSYDLDAKARECRHEAAAHRAKADALEREAERQAHEATLARQAEAEARERAEAKRRAEHEALLADIDVVKQRAETEPEVAAALAELRTSLERI